MLMMFLDKSLFKCCVIPFSVFLLSGCNNSKENQRPYVIGATHTYIKKDTTNTNNHSSIIEVQKIKSQTQKEIALINKQRDIEVERLKQETSVNEAKIKKEVAFKKTETDLLMAEKTIETQKISTILTTSVALIAIAVLAYFLYKRRQDKLKMHQDEINKELYIKDRELQAQMANRLLDTLERKSLTPEQETKLIDSITKTADVKPINLIENKS